MLRALPALFDQLATHNHVPGAQFTLYHDGRLLELVAGVEHIHRRTPVTSRSRFALGSVSKVITAAAVMQLLEDGDVDLDAPVARFLPRALAGHATAGAITLRQLLSHTSGLVADHIDGAETPDSSLRKQAASVLAEDLVSRPGSTFSYSNSGYSLVGYVIEAVAGRSWWDTMQSYLFDPCDLDLAFIGDPRDGAQQASVVTGHAVDSSSGAAVPVDFYCEHTMAPAGGLAASASTLVSFARSFMVSSDRRADEPVADIKTLKHMWSPVPGASPFGLADGWGAGWALYRRDDRVWAGHDGTLDGGTCHMRLDPSGGTALALTTNSTTGLVMWSQLVDALDSLGLHVGSYRMPDLAARPGPAPAGLDISGHYTNGDLAITVLPVQGEGYRMNMPNGLHGTIALCDDLRFSVQVGKLGNMNFMGRFDTDPDDGSTIGALEYNGRRLRRTSGLSSAHV